jgi:hypothetical protein
LRHAIVKVFPVTPSAVRTPRRTAAKLHVAARWLFADELRMQWRDRDHGQVNGPEQGEGDSRHNLIGHHVSPLQLKPRPQPPGTRPDRKRPNGHYGR